MSEKRLKKDEVAENISDELREVYRKKIKEVAVCRSNASMNTSRNYKTLEDYGKEFWSAPPMFMIVKFEDGSEVGILKGKQIVSPQSYSSLQNKVKESILKTIYNSPNGITYSKIETILPELLFSAVDPNTGEPYLSQMEKTLARELKEPRRGKIARYVAELMHDGQIIEENIPHGETLYFSGKK